MRINAVIGSMTLALTATVLAACGSSGGGSSSSGGYCDELKADKTYFESLSGSNADISNLDQVFEKVHTLAADAPDNVSDDWKTLDDAITTIETALSDAGLKPSDLAALQKRSGAAGRRPLEAPGAGPQAADPQRQRRQRRSEEHRRRRQEVLRSRPDRQLKTGGHRRSSSSRPRHGPSVELVETTATAPQSTGGGTLRLAGRRTSRCPLPAWRVRRTALPRGPAWRRNLPKSSALLPSTKSYGWLRRMLGSGSQLQSRLLSCEKSPVTPAGHRKAGTTTTITTKSTAPSSGRALTVCMYAPTIAPGQHEQEHGRHEVPAPRDQPGVDEDTEQPTPSTATPRLRPPPPMRALMPRDLSDAQMTGQATRRPDATTTQGTRQRPGARDPLHSHGVRLRRLATPRGRMQDFRWTVRRGSSGEDRHLEP